MVLLVLQWNVFVRFYICYTSFYLETIQVDYFAGFASFAMECMFVRYTSFYLETILVDYFAICDCVTHKVKS